MSGTFALLSFHFPLEGQRGLLLVVQVRDDLPALLEAGLGQEALEELAPVLR